MEISFIGPYSWAEAFTAPEACQRGIYAHTVLPQGKDHHLVYYVGQTGARFYDAMRRHDGHFRGARYAILPAASFAQGSAAGRFNQGIYGRNRDPKDTCRANSVRLAKEIQAMLDVTLVFFAPFEADQRTRERIEAAIMHELQANPKSKSFYAEGIARCRRRPHEAEFRCWINSPVKLLGMPVSVRA